MATLGKAAKPEAKAWQQCEAMISNGKVP